MCVVTGGTGSTAANASVYFSPGWLNLNSANILTRGKRLVLKKGIAHASLHTEFPPFLAYRDESRRVLKSVPRPNDKHCARERHRASVACARVFPRKAFPKRAGSSRPFGPRRMD